MKTYRKPVITIDSGMAEGVYAASGASTSNYTLVVSDDGVIANYTPGGQRNYTLDLNSVAGKNVKLYLKFNTDIANGWGGGASSTVDGSTLTLSWYTAPSSATITIQTNTDITAVVMSDCGYLDVHDN